MPLPSSLSYLRPYIVDKETGPVSFFTSYRRFGPTKAECVKTILNTNPDTVYFSLFAFCYAEPAVELAGALKETGKVPTACGGAGVTVLPEYFRKTGYFDEVYEGEGERCLLDPPEEEIEFPLSVTGETRHRIFISVSATRGCDKECAFCSVRLHHGRGLRKTPPEKIERGLAELSGKIGTAKQISINFEDDNLFSDPDFAFEVMDRFKRYFPDCSFTAENGLDYLTLNESVLSRMLEKGFFRFNFSLGSYHRKSLEASNRRGNIPHLQALTNFCNSRGTTPAVFFICGLPDDTPAGIVETLLFLQRINVKTGISLFYPVPGLPPLLKPETLGAMENIQPRRMTGSAAYPWNGSLTTGEMITAFRLARFNNWLMEDNRQEAEETAKRARREHTFYSRIKNGKRRFFHPIDGLSSEMITTYFTNLTSI